MPLYYFNLKDATGLTQDPDGTHFPDEVAARDHARIVAGELMRNCEVDRRTWRLEICDGERRPSFHLLFVEVDPLLARLPPEVQGAIIDGWTRSVSLRDTIEDLQMTMRQVKATLARANGAPYVTAINGVRI
jgi:hypothetical protein